MIFTPSAKNTCISFVSVFLYSLSALAATGESLEPVVAPKPARKTDKAVNQKYLLRYHFEQGEQVHYYVQHKTKMHSRLGEAVEIAKNKSSIKKHFHVLSIDNDGNAILQLMLDQVTMEASYDGGEAIKWDSSEDQAVPPQFKMIKQSIGRPLARIKISPQGNLLSVPHVAKQVKVHNELFNKGVQSADNDPSRNFLVIFPQGEIAVGDSWTNKIEVPFAVSKKLHKSATLQRRYKLISVQGAEAIIELKTTLLTIINDPTIRVQLIQRAPAGKITFDLEKGKITARNLTIDKTEIGALGPKSSLHAVSSVKETLLNVERVAGKE